MDGMLENVTHLVVASHITVETATNWLENRKDFVKLMALGLRKNFQHVFVSKT